MRLKILDNQQNNQYKDKLLFNKKTHSISYSCDSQFNDSQFFTSERQRKFSFKQNKQKQIQHKNNDLQSTQISLSSIQYQKRKNSENINKANQYNKNKRLINNQQTHKLKNKTRTTFFKSINDLKHFRRQNRGNEHSKSFCDATNKIQQNERIDPSSLQIHLSVQSLVTQNNKKQQKQQQIRVVEIFRNDMKKLITSKTKNSKPIMIKLNKRLIYNQRQINGSFIKISKIITDVEKN